MSNNSMSIIVLMFVLPRSSKCVSGIECFVQGKSLCNQGFRFHTSAIQHCNHCREFIVVGDRGVIVFSLLSTSFQLNSMGCGTNPEDRPYRLAGSQKERFPKAVGSPHTRKQNQPPSAGALQDNLAGIGLLRVNKSVAPSSSAKRRLAEDFSITYTSMTPHARRRLQRAQSDRSPANYSRAAAGFDFRPPQRVQSYRKRFDQRRCT